MARRSKFSAQKRIREAAKLQKKQEKAERRELVSKDIVDDSPDGRQEDPDLAGIIPGPQPRWYDTKLPEEGGGD
jgi:hypothetical protein